MRPFDGILLDLDDTVYDYETAHRAALDFSLGLASERFGLARQQALEKYHEARQSVHGSLPGRAACHSRLLYFQRMMEALGINSLENALEIHDAYWDTFLENMTPFPGVFEFLDSVRTLKICILSDLTTCIQMKKIRKLGLQKYTDTLVTSEEAGVEKPAPEIFQLALRKTGIQASRLCVIGDSWGRDIEGALASGIKPFWFNHRRQAAKTNPAVTEFTDWRDLKGVFHE